MENCGENQESSSGYRGAGAFASMGKEIALVCAEYKRKRQYNIHHSQYDEPAIRDSEQHYPGDLTPNGVSSISIINEILFPCLNFLKGSL